MESIRNPQQPLPPEQPTDIDINIMALLEHLHAHWKLTLLAAFISFIMSLSLSFILPNTYRSSAMLEPSDELQGGGLSAVAGQLGGIASLAGIDISNNKTKIYSAIETLKSREFVHNFIESNDLYISLFAVKSWDSDLNELAIDSEIYNSETKEWVRSTQDNKSQKPSKGEAYEKFIKKLSVKEDKQTGLIQVSFDHISPFKAKEVNTLLIQNINNYVRSRDIAQAETSISYLKSKTEDIAFSEMRSVFFKLIEEQIKKRMLAEVRDDYVFRVIDPPFLPEEPHSPNRILITISGTAILMIVFCSALIFLGSPKLRFAASRHKE